MINLGDYWNKLKKNIKQEGSNLVNEIVRLKIPSSDGKERKTDTLNTENILRLIQSIPVSEAEPFKMWFAKIGKDRIDEVLEPEIALDRIIDYYRARGFSYKWIENKITDFFKEKNNSLII